MISFKILKAMLENSIIEKQKQGYDVTSYHKQLIDLPVSYDALFDLERRVQQAPYRDDWAYVEPDSIQEIMAECDPMRQVDSRLSLSRDSVRKKIRAGFLASVCACVLGKPLEEPPYGTLWDIREAAMAVGEWPFSNYVSERFLEVWGRRNPSWIETTLGNIRHVAPDDDITYTICGMLLLERKGVHFKHADIAQLWIENLPIYSCWGPERTMLLRAGMQSLNPAEPTDPQDWANFFNPGQEYCGALIRADAYGYACPGNPELAVKLAWRDASFTHRKTGVYAAMYVAAAIALSFEALRPLDAMASALMYVPQESRFYHQMTEALDIVSNATSFDSSYKQLQKAFHEYGACRIIQELGTIMNTLRFAENTESGIGLQVAQGNDTDSFGCTCGAILGVYFGEELPDRWLSPFNDTIHTTMGDFHETSLHAVTNRMMRLPEIVKETQ